MLNLKEFKPVPHPSAPIFQKHKIPRSAIAEALGLSYSYVCNLLTGVRKSTPTVDSKLRELADQLESERGT
jgi:hypothetical protein